MRRFLPAEMQIRVHGTNSTAIRSQSGVFKKASWQQETAGSRADVIGTVLLAAVKGLFRQAANALFAVVKVLAAHPGEARAHKDVPDVVHVRLVQPRLPGRLGQVRVAGPPALLPRDQLVRIVVTARSCVKHTRWRLLAGQGVEIIMAVSH